MASMTGTIGCHNCFLITSMAFWVNDACTIERGALFKEWLEYPEMD